MKEFIKHQTVIDEYLKLQSLSKVSKNLNITVRHIKKILDSNGIPTPMRKRSLDIKYFEKIDSAEKAYWLGFIVADGCIQKSGYKLTIGVKDKDVLPKFKKAIDSGSPISSINRYDKRTGKTYDIEFLQVNSKEFCQYIKNHGVDENKSKSFKFPIIEEKYYSHFVRGIFDGDGNVTIINNRYRINLLSTSECLIFIKDYLKTIEITTQEIYYTKYVNLCSISIQKDAFKFLEWIYKDSTKSIRLDRKYEKFIKNIDSFQETKRIIKNIYTGEEYLIHNVAEFCREKNLDFNFLAKAGKENKPSKTGIHKGWILIPKNKNI